MPPSSSGGLTIGEAMNILARFDQSGDRVDALYRYLEASKLAYADRGQYDGDTDFVHVPITGLLSKAYAAQRASLIGAAAARTPVAAGNAWAFQPGGTATAYQTSAGDGEQHTNHLVVADRFGNVVSYTNTIEQIAGSGILLAHRGFLLNNELTDFNFAPGTANSVQPDKRPRSSMSPTLVFRRGKLVEALGSPGGATTSAEPAFISQYGPALQARGEAFSSMPYIGIAAGLVLLNDHRLETATEAWRGGGGSAMVVKPGSPVPAP
jgi:gamma-glutamyltranspeptidase/glutathione hydrolase